MSGWTTRRVANSRCQLGLSSSSLMPVSCRSLMTKMKNIGSLPRTPPKSGSCTPPPSREWRT
ncbi:hypothetical protein GBAR_LOCUS759 [Geodia barretti]|uniref:Uncharacterized protein n=1 Tax=Geodia barretti TaxID=519541 RepID=A0AA35VZ15_GEOBA|nr:hypothetical protein GBAR_LOCUS759 [Geodia barretti]